MSEFDPIGRELCPDGSCIGIIGPDRTCRVCGRPSERPLDPRLRGLSRPAGEDPPSDQGALDRELCPDGACVGVLGANGRCGTCGMARDADRGGAESPLASAARTGADDADNAVLADPEFADRELCPDGACIGLIGTDGRCQECGLSRPF